MIKLHKDELNQLRWEGRSEDVLGAFTYKTVSDQPFTRHRWTERRKLVFTDGEKFWAVTYEEGLTEDQEVDAWIEDQNGHVECTEVYPVEQTITVYVGDKEMFEK